MVWGTDSAISPKILTRLTWAPLGPQGKPKMISNRHARGHRVLGPLVGLALAFFAFGINGALAQPQSFGTAGTAVARPQGAVPGQYIVVFKDGVADPRGLAAVMGRRHGFRVQHSYQTALKGFAARMPAVVAEALSGDPDVALVEPDLYAYASVHDLPAGFPTGVSRIGADLNDIAEIDGVDTRVDADIAIIDTGIDLDHPDLNVHSAVDCTRGPNCQRGGDGNDDNGHGTHVAGIAAALDDGIGAVGVAPGARLWGVKVLRSDGSGFISDIIQGLEYVTSNAAEIEVANMSLSALGQSVALRTAVQAAVSEGVVLVAAAGNAGMDVFGTDGVFGHLSDVIPAAYPEVAAVSGLADDDGHSGGIGLGFVVLDGEGNIVEVVPDDTLVRFWNFSASVAPGNPVTSLGAAIDVAAPGVLIESTWNNGGYNSISGTSMASPHVAGAVALEIALNGRATNAGGVAVIRQALIGSAEPQTSWGPDGTFDTKDPDSNHEGLVNVATSPGNATPVVVITSPTNGDPFDSGALVMFDGTATDTEDGPLTGSLVWSSDLDGNIGEGGMFDAVLTTDGVHVITAEVTDSGGATGSASVTVTVGNVAPTVAISDPADGAVIFSTGGAATVSFAGSAMDTEDDDVVLTANLSWSSDLVVGEIGTGESFDAVLVEGIHVITAEVTDNDGATGSDSATIEVKPQPVGPTFVDAVDITHILTGGRKKRLSVRIDLRDDLGGPVAGASVGIESALQGTSRVWGGTGTTNSNGSVTFKLINAPAGTGDCYVTTVKNITSNLIDPTNDVVEPLWCVP